MAPRKPIYNSSSNSLTSSRKSAPNPIHARKASPKKERPLKAIFRGKVMSIAGNITTHGGDPITYESIAKWITLHGGIYEREVSEDTTHLICSIEEYKKGTEQVRKAWKLGKKKCNIVVFDWLEDCLIGKKMKKGLKTERGYTLDRTLARIKKGKTDHAEYRKRFEEGVRASKELCDSRLYHIYSDHEDFEYKVALTRVDLGGRVMTEKYTCYLFESNAVPHVYMTGAKLSRSHRPVTYYREYCHPMDFLEAFYWFRYFFAKKTGIDWDQRLEGIKMPDNFFVYTPPVLGRPVGALPNGYKRPEFRVKEAEEDEEKEVVYDTDSEAEYSDSEEDSAHTRSTTSAGSRVADDEEEFSHDFGKTDDSRGSEKSGESEHTQSSEETDGLGSALEDITRPTTPPSVIYLSD